MLQAVSADTKKATARGNSRPLATPGAHLAPPSLAHSNQATLRLMRKCDCGGDCDCGMANDRKKEKDSPKTALHRKASGPPLVPPVSHTSSIVDSGTRHFFEARLQHRSSHASSTPIGPRLRIGTVDDPLEAEADRIAERVMRMPVPSGMFEAGYAKKGEDLQRKAAGTAASGYAPPIVNEVLSSSGQSLDSTTLAFMGPRFGYDFSRVRVHADARAAESARAVSARAYTVGANIMFGERQYDPSGHEGRRLLSHELAHVVQQGGAGGSVARSGALAVNLRTSTTPVQRDFATPPPAAPAPAQPDLTPAQIAAAISFNAAHYDGPNTRLIQGLIGGPVTGVWTEENIVAVASSQEEFGLKKDGKIGNDTFRFLDHEQGLEGASTNTEDCLVSFSLIGPDPATFGRDDPTHCHFGSHFRFEAQFSPRCNCDQFQYRQFIAGHWRRTRGGVVTDLPIREPGGVLAEAFQEDTDTSDPVPHYGHREQAAGANVEDHYVNAAGTDDQAHGCRYRGEDFPGFTNLGDCQPGDQYDLVTRFRGEIQRNGRPVQTKFWRAINILNWRP